MDEKERVYGRRYPLDEDFLAAIARMPEASGVALGFERLVMLATGAPHIDMVLWTPAPRRDKGRAMTSVTQLSLTTPRRSKPPASSRTRVRSHPSRRVMRCR